MLIYFSILLLSQCLSCLGEPWVGWQPSPWGALLVLHPRSLQLLFLLALRLPGDGQGDTALASCDILPREPGGLIWIVENVLQGKNIS